MTNAPRYLSAVLVCILAGSTLQAQSISPRTHYIGTAESSALDAAREAALRAMVEQIQVFVSSTFSSGLQEHNATIDRSAMARTVARSMITLRDVQESVTRTPEKAYKVTKWVSRESVAEVFRQRRREAEGHLRIAERTLDTNPVDIAAALRHYYRAFLFASLTPDTLCYNGVTATAEIPRLMRQLVQHVRFEGVTRMPNELNVWKAAVRCGDRSVGDLDLEYYDGMGQTVVRVQNSQAVFALFFADANRPSRELSLLLEYRYPEELDDLLAIADSMRNGSLFDNRVVVVLEQKSEYRNPKSQTNPKNQISNQQSSMTSPALPSAVVSLLQSGSSFDTFLKTLNDLVRQGKVVQGSAKNFDSLEGLYGAVVDKNGLAAMVHCAKGKYTDVQTGAEMNMEEFAGKRIVWIDVP